MTGKNKITLPKLVRRKFEYDCDLSRKIMYALSPYTTMNCIPGAHSHFESKSGIIKNSTDNISNGYWIAKINQIPGGEIVIDIGKESTLVHLSYLPEATRKEPARTYVKEITEIIESTAKRGIAEIERKKAGMSPMERELFRIRCKHGLLQ